MRIRFLVASLALIAAIAVAPSAAADVPVCSLPDRSFAEGDGGIFIPSFKADCTALVPHDLLFHLRTADGTAVAPADYQAIDFDAGPMDKSSRSLSSSSATRTSSPTRRSR